MNRNPNELARYTRSERINHWLVALCLVLAAFSGLVFFHPLFWPLNQLFGGGVWTRILHPYIGLALVIFFASMFMRFRALNRMMPADWDWMKRLGKLTEGNDRNMPAQEKFNGGQKLMFWTVSVLLALMVLSGLVLWRAWFNFPAVPVRLAAVIHAACGALFIAVIIGHIYLAIWTRGTIHGMVYGTVSRAWAKQHHAIWYRRQTEG